MLSPSKYQVITLMLDWQNRASKTAVVGVTGTLLLSGWAKHDLCFYFNNSVRELLILVLFFWAITLMAVLPPKGQRLLYIAVGAGVLAVVSAIVQAPIDRPNSAWALKEGAIHVFKDGARSLDQYHTQHRGYPASFEVKPSSPVLRRYFEFQYVPVHVGDGAVGTYRIEARPAHSPCGCSESLTFTPDGSIYATTQLRAATSADELIRKVAW